MGLINVNWSLVQNHSIVLIPLIGLFWLIVKLSIEKSISNLRDKLRGDFQSRAEAILFHDDVVELRGKIDRVDETVTETRKEADVLFRELLRRVEKLENLMLSGKDGA